MAKTRGCVVSAVRSDLLPFAKEVSVLASLSRVRLFWEGCPFYKKDPKNVNKGFQVTEKLLMTFGCKKLGYWASPGFMFGSQIYRYKNKKI